MRPEPDPLGGCMGVLVAFAITVPVIVSLLVLVL